MSIILLWLICSAIAIAAGSLYGHVVEDCWWAGGLAAIITFPIPAFLIIVLPELL
jgi:hypothetical protein